MMLKPYSMYFRKQVVASFQARGIAPSLSNQSDVVMRGAALEDNRKYCRERNGNIPWNGLTCRRRCRDDHSSRPTASNRSFTRLIIASFIIRLSSHVENRNSQS